MFGSEVTVTVTGENEHQAVLARHRPGATVAVELGWCVIRTGKHRGEQAIEVLLDGQRAGELTHAMSLRYGQAVAWVIANGGRPGCWGRITATAKGLEIVLRLPKDPADIPNSSEPPTAVIVPAAVAVAVPVTRNTPGARPWLIATAVVALIVFLMAVVGGGDEEPDVANGAAATETTTTTTTPPTTTTTTTTPPPTTTTTTTTTPPPPPPTPKRTTTQAPAPPPAPKPAPKPEPKPEPACHPNYGGCVPVASDVDCAGGSGNGPAYVQGPVRVIGADVYDLDRDGDGTACDS